MLEKQFVPPVKPPGSFVTLYCRDRSAKKAYALRYSDGPKVHDMGFGPRQGPYRLTNSCNGLVGVCSRSGFWIANPSIPRLAVLPRGSPHFCRSTGSANLRRHDIPHTAIGLADASTGEYKVVRMFVREQAEHYPISLGCEVLSRKESLRSWKQVEDPPAYPLEMFSVPLVVDGIVYWTVRTMWGRRFKPQKIRSKLRKSVIALCFDLREEEFSLLHHPNGWAREGIIMSKLFLLEGRPCLVDAYPGRRITVWRLEDRASSQWVRRRDFCDKSDITYVSYMAWKVHYELPTIDYDDVEALRLLKNETSDSCLQTFAGDVMEYRNPYTASNFWPF